MKRRRGTPEPAEDLTPPAIRDLKTQVDQHGKNATRGARGAVEVAYMRGFQGGYQQAMLDQANGCLNRDNALRFSRVSEPGGISYRSIT